MVLAVGDILPSTKFAEAITGIESVEADRLSTGERVKRGAAATVETGMWVLGSKEGQQFLKNIIGKLKFKKAATETGSNLPVKYDPDFAAQQILNSPTNVTQGGRTITTHAAERMVTPPPGRAPTSMAQVDQFLDTATEVRKITPHPLGDTITLRNASSPIKEVVVDAATGKRVITVVTPQ